MQQILGSHAAVVDSSKRLPRTVILHLRVCPPPPAGKPAVYPAGTPRAAIPITKEIPHKTTRPIAIHSKESIITKQRQKKRWAAELQSLVGQ